MLKVRLLLLYQDGYRGTTEHWSYMYNQPAAKKHRTVAARLSVSLAADCNYPYEVSRQCPAADE